MGKASMRAIVDNSVFCERSGGLFNKVGLKKR